MNKKKILPIVLIIIAILLILFGVWFFFFKENKKETKEPTTEDKEPSKEKEYKNYDEYEYTYGMLIPMSDDNWKPLQEEFVIDGMILIGSKHKYYELERGSEKAIEEAVKDGYKDEGINSFFYLGETIKIYIDTKYKGKEKDIKIFAVPMMSKKELREISYSTLKETAEQKGFVVDYKKPDESNNKYVGENHVSTEYEAGQYDIVITYKEKVAYYMNMIVSIEPKGE